MNTETDTRNVVDRFKWWLDEDIRDDLKTTRSGFVSIFINVLGDFNLSSGIRNLNWFNGQETVIVGRKKWDRRGACGTHNYTNVKYSMSLSDTVTYYREQGFKIVAAEVDDRSIDLPKYQWQEKTAVMFGEEGAGLSEEAMMMADDIVSVPGRGSVRSLNVANTSGIMMYDYSVKMGLI